MNELPVSASTSPLKPENHGINGAKAISDVGNSARQPSISRRKFATISRGLCGGIDVD